MKKSIGGKFRNCLLINIVLLFMVSSLIAQGRNQHFKIPEINMPFTEKNVDVGGYKLNCRIFESGKPVVVFINGFGATQRYWNGIITEIAKEATVISYDRQGFGKSEMGKEACTGWKAASDLKILLDKTGLEGPYLFVAHSYGAHIARIFSATNPGQIMGIILIDPSNEDARNGTEKLLSGNLLAQFKEMTGQMPPMPGGMGAEMKGWSATEDIVRGLSKLPDVPLKILSAGIKTDDPMFPEEINKKIHAMNFDFQKKLAGSVNGGEYILIEGAGHNLHLEKPDTVISEIKKMILKFDENTFERAVKNSDKKKSAELLSKNPALLKLKDSTGKTPLHIAARDCNSEMVGWLVKQGAEINVKDISGYTPLLLAAWYGRAEVVKLLLDNGARVDDGDGNTQTPLNYACGSAGRGGSLEIVKMLVECGAKINGPKNNCAPLSGAVRKGYRDIVNYLIEKGCEIPAGKSEIQYLAKYAARGGMVKLFNKLIELGADIKTPNSNGASFIHYAADSEFDSSELIKILLDEKLDINQRDFYGSLPLHYAAINNNCAVAETLIKNGANLNAKDFMGQTALNIASSSDFNELAGLLIKYKADKSEIEFPELKGKYFGQTKKNKGPEIFAPGIVAVNKNAHSVPVFSPDGKEVYWCTDSRILYSKLKNGKWTVPEYTSFSQKEFWNDVPFVSPDARKIFFTSRRQIQGKTGADKENIWYVERKGDGWGDPLPLPDAINNMQLHWQVSADCDGTIYFAARRNDSRGGSDIFCSRIDNGVYQLPVNMGDEINSKNSETCPFISPAGDYIIFTRLDRTAEYGASLYISFKKENGRWTDAKPLDIPYVDFGLGTYVTPDEKYIFYLDGFGGQNTAYWTEGDIIKKVRDKVLGNEQK